MISAKYKMYKKTRTNTVIESGAGPLMSKDLLYV